LAETEKTMETWGATAGQAQQWAERECQAFLLSLSKQWFLCKVWHYPNGPLNIEDAASGVVGGMSGSPIVAEDGRAIGIVCIGSVTHNPSSEPDLDSSTGGGPNPSLVSNLSGWLLKELTDAAISSDATTTAD
jgi:hypothetical protein